MSESFDADLDEDVDEDVDDDVDDDVGNRVVGALPRDVLEYVARQIVDEPDAVVIELDESGRNRVDLRLHVAPDDMGKIIGRRGRVAQSIRTLVRAAGAREGVDTSVDIVDQVTGGGLEVGRLEVGRVVKPHGLRGEVVVDLVTNRTERLAPGSVLGSTAGDLEVERSSPHRGRWIVAFAGIDDRSGAETLRGMVLSASAVHDPDALWVHDLVGSEVETADGRGHGTVVAVEANPASDLLVLDGGELVPLRFVVSHRAGRVVVDPPEGLLP